MLRPYHGPSGSSGKDSTSTYTSSCGRLVIRRSPRRGSLLDAAAVCVACLRRWNPLGAIRASRLILAFLARLAEPNCPEEGWPRSRSGPTNDHLALLRSIEIGSACAGSMAGVARRSLVMRSLNDEVDLALCRIHVVQAVVRTDRVGVCACSGWFARTRKSNARSARRSFHLASESGAGRQRRDNSCANRSRKLLAHTFLPLPPWRCGRNLWGKEILVNQPLRRRRGIRASW